MDGAEELPVLRRTPKEVSRYDQSTPSTAADNVQEFLYLHVH